MKWVIFLAFSFEKAGEGAGCLLGMEAVEAFLLYNRLVVV